jgi:hypothetical protein
MLIIKRSNNNFLLKQRKKLFFLCNNLTVLPYSFGRKLYISLEVRTYQYTFFICPAIYAYMLLILGAFIMLTGFYNFQLIGYNESKTLCNQQ